MLAGFPVKTIAISIHALREEGDTGLRISDALEINFYPRPPRGGRLCATSSPS